MEDSVMTNAEAPAPKKRATRARGSNAAVDASVLTLASQPDAEMEEAVIPAKAPTGRKKGRTASATKRPRKGSAASIASTASTASLRSKVPNDDELDRQLVADLERPLTPDELVGDSDSERRKAAVAAPKAKGKRVPSRKMAPSQELKADFAMFDPAPSQPDEAAVEAELKALETEMEMDSRSEEIKIPKKGRKAAPRKASKQVKKKEDVPAEPDEPPAERILQPEAEGETREDHDMSMASTGTVVKDSSEAPAPAKRGRGRPPKKSKEPQVVEPQITAPLQAVRMLVQAVVDDAEETTAIRHSVSLLKESPAPLGERSPAAPAPRAQPPAMPQPKTAALAPPSTPRAHHITSAHSAKQATISPSPSPQSSDAENQPPSSKPAASAAGKRVALAPLSTPVRTGSPSKRANNVLGGLRSEVPWTAVDLELVFGADGDAGAEGLLARGADLATPERNMTVEEWIYHNAGRAEERLRHECEAMVSAFEREGTRAMRVLEGLVVD